MTGYKIAYVPGGSATPVIKPFPRFWETESFQSGFARMLGMTSYVYKPSEGIAVFCDNNLAAFHTVNPDHTIPNFVPPDFNPDGKTYRQLTPDGVLK